MLIHSNEVNREKTSSASRCPGVSRAGAEANETPKSRQEIPRVKGAGRIFCACSLCRFTVSKRGVWRKVATIVGMLSRGAQLSGARYAQLGVLVTWRSDLDANPW